MKTRIIQIFEHANFDFRENGIDISGRTAEKILDVSKKLREEFGAEIFSVELDGRGKPFAIRAHQFVGVIQIDEALIVEFLPKMYNPDNQGNKFKGALKNLFFMLDYSGELAKISKNKSGYGLDYSSIFETLIGIFADNLLLEVRKSPNYEYVNFEKNRRFLQGKLKIMENLKRNFSNRARFITEKDEFTIDNDLNRILKFTARKMLAKSGNERNQRILRNVLFELEDVRLLGEVSALDFSKIKFTRLNERFESSLRMAEILLGRKYLSRAGFSNDNFVILWDMNRIFESFIARILIKNAPEKYEIKAQFGGKYLTRNRNFKLKPDILIRKNGADSKIIDTKYKILNLEDKNLGVAQADAYQMFAYSKKFGVAEVMLLYPGIFNDEELADFEFDENSKLLIRAVNLSRDIVQDIVDIEKEVLRLL